MQGRFVPSAGNIELVLTLPLNPYFLWFLRYLVNLNSRIIISIITITVLYFTVNRFIFTLTIAAN